MEYFDEPRLVDIDPAEAKVANRANWDARVPIHAGPGGYSLDELVAGRVSEVVEFDRERLGDLTGLDVVHLQCHLGADTISLAHLGAASITGLDFSAPALAHAATLVARTGIEIPTRWVESDVYDAPAALGRRYDLVYTGVGALNWLPDIAGWARVVADCLAPGGRLHLFEAHPMFWAGADEPAEGTVELAYPYFEERQALAWDEAETYGGPGTVAATRGYEWNHGIGEIVTALAVTGLRIDALTEHRVLPWQGPTWWERVPDTQDWTRLPEPLDGRMPLSYTLQATKEPRP